MQMDIPYDAEVLILGGGAAGLMCAYRLGELGIQAIVLEKNREVGRKILISGGGRCNFTNREVGFENFRSHNPHYARSALARYTSGDFIDLVNQRGIDWYEKTLGQLFCKRSAREIVALLRDGVLANGSEIRTGVEVLELAQRDSGGFLVETSAGPLRTRRVVVATGGLSIPKIGASKIGYDIARAQGLKVKETRPALVALEAGGSLRDLCRDLSGVALPAEVWVEGQGPSFKEQVLFTHWGLSGPAILQASLYWEPKRTVRINWFPDGDLEESLLSAMRSGSKASAAKWLSEFVPTRFAEAWTQTYLKDPTRPMSQLGAKPLRALGEAIHRWPFEPSGTGGYKKAEVTVGGVDTDALHSKSMETKEIPGLYFIGEVVDVTGWLGGYNFQWAWSSAVAAAGAIAAS